MNQPIPPASTPKTPLAELLALAGPTVAQMASYTLMQFIDTWMLASWGEVLPTAAGQAGMVAWSVLCMGIGVLSVVNTLVSQNFGSGDLARCGRYLWLGVWFCVGYWLLILPLAWAGPALFSAFGHEPSLVRLESAYLQIVVGAAVMKMVATAFSQFLLATDRPGAVFAASITGVGANIIAAALLIQPTAWLRDVGQALGIGPAGVVGAAWAQNIGVGVEMLALAGFAVRPKVARMFNVGDWRLRPDYFRRLLGLGTPAGLQFFGDMTSWTLFSVWVMAPFGTSVMAANQFMFRFMAVSFMPPLGVGMAVTALVGRYIGAGQPQTGEQRAHLAFRLTALYMLSCGLVFFLGRNLLIGIFTDDPAVQAAGATLLVFGAIYQCFDAMYIIYNGALRGAGDTLVPGVVTAGLCWGLTVGGGYAATRLFPELGAAGPWSAATLYGIILGIFMYARFQWGKWRTLKVTGGEAEAAQVVVGA